MGVYVFSMTRLVELLHEDHSRDSTHDFGKDILPSIVATHRVDRLSFWWLTWTVTPIDIGGIGHNRCVLRGEHGSAASLAADRPVSGELADPHLRGAASSGTQRAWQIWPRGGIVNCMLASGTLIIGGTCDTPSCSERSCRRGNV